MADGKIKINRAPVLTLWGAVVAERLGFDPEEALTLGKAVAGLNAQSKGQRLGIYQPGEADENERQRLREREAEDTFFIEIVGRPVPAVNTEGGVRATAKGDPIEPRSVQRYLEKKFGTDLEAAREAMQDLAKSFDRAELARRAFGLYEKFRPEVPEGTRGWGAAGDLDLERIRSLKKKASAE